MEISKELIKEMLTCYLKATLKELLPLLLKEAIASNDLFIGQDFVSIEEATRRYNICRRPSTIITSAGTSRFAARKERRLYR